MDKNCKNCEHEDLDECELPCSLCMMSGNGNTMEWKAKRTECRDCQCIELPADKEPCRSCPNKKAKTDSVNKPAHYNTGRIECIEYIEDKLTKEQYEGFLQGNVIKYVSRYKYKNGVEDLKKADWYLKRLIGVLENG